MIQNDRNPRFLSVFVFCLFLFGSFFFGTFFGGSSFGGSSFGGSSFGGATALYAEDGIHLSLGTDVSLVTLTVGYSHRFDITPIDRDLVWRTEVSLPLLRPDFGEFRFSTSAEMDTLKVDSFHLPLSMKVILRGHSNSAFEVVGIGTEIGIAPGYYSDTWFAAPEVSWDAQWISLVTPTDLYQQVTGTPLEPEWIGLTSHIFRAGVRGGVNIGDHFNLLLRGGYEYHGQFDLKIPPFYAVLETGFRF